MKLTLLNKKYIFECRYGEHHTAKDAGFKWDPASKTWGTSEQSAALKLAKYADSTLLEMLQDAIKQENAAIEASKAIDSNIDIPTPAGLELFPFQKAGVAFAADKKYTLISDQPGCVDGDAIVTVCRAGGSRKMKLSKLVHSFNGGKSTGGKKWDLTIPTNIRCLYNGEFRSMPITWAGFKGEKECLLITLADGKNIKVTQDHEVLTPNGYVAAQSLALGDVVITNGINTCKRCGATKDIITYKYAKFIGWCKTCAYRHGRKNHIKNCCWEDKDGYIQVSEGVKYHPMVNSNGVPEHRLVIEAELNGLSFQRYRHLLREGLISNLKFLPKNLQVHHVNENTSCNRLENLKVVTPSQHLVYHQAQKRFIKTLPKQSTIVKIELAGKVKVYDITVPHADNFVANGIVVHNCGKTLQAIGVSNYKGHKNILIICPASLKGNWERECAKWLTGGQSIGIVNSQDGWINTDVIIINYDILKKYRDCIRGRKWDLLICDESHYLKNADTIRAKEIMGDKKLSPISAKQTIFLTGTPILNRPIELWPTLKYFGVFNNWYSFVTRYCAGQKTKWGFETGGASNLEELGRILRSKCMIRRLKDDVLKELPPKIRRTIYLDADVEDVDVDAMKKVKSSGFELSADLGDFDAIFNTLASERIKLGRAKIPGAVDYILELLNGSEEQLVIFAHHREVLAGIESALIARKITCVRVDGSTNKKLVSPAVDGFQSGKYRVFIGSHGACGVGLTLTAANHVVVIEPQWNPAALIQSEDRCHRVGSSGSHILIDYLVVKDSVDSFVLEKVLSKAEIETKVLDGIEVQDIPTLESIKQSMEMDKKIRQEILAAKKAHRVSKGFEKAFIEGKHLKAIIDVGGELKEIIRADDGVIYAEGNKVSNLYYDALYHIGRCSACGRVLTDPESIERGLGPVCAGTN